MIKRILLAIFLFASLTLRAMPAGAVVWSGLTAQSTGPTNQTTTSQGILSPGGAVVTGSAIFNPIGTPSAPTMTTNGTAGATSAVYACTGFDINGNQTIPSPTATITTANATLSTTNSVNVTCPGKLGAVGFLVHKVDTSHIIGFCYANSGSSCTFVDTGTYVLGNGTGSQTSSFTYTPNVNDQTGGLVGHVAFSAGQAAVPAPGTGTTTAGGSDSAFEVTGGTSPVTVTFTTAFTKQPICVCTDETSATGVCKIVPNSNGATAVVTTAGTDSFNVICLGK